MNGLHLIQIKEYYQIVIHMKHKGKTCVFFASKHSVSSGDLQVRAKTDRNENKKNSLSKIMNPA